MGDSIVSNMAKWWVTPLVGGLDMFPSSAVLNSSAGWDADHNVIYICDFPPCRRTERIRTRRSRKGGKFSSWLFWSPATPYFSFSPSLIWKTCNFLGRVRRLKIPFSLLSIHQSSGNILPRWEHCPCWPWSLVFVLRRGFFQAFYMNIPNAHSPIEMTNPFIVEKYFTPR